jgi:gliding motility-associated protein GldE
LEVELLLWILLFIFFLLLSSFFSSSEAAYFSLSQNEVQKLQEEEEKSKSARRAIRLLQKSKRLLSSILIGNTIVNVAAATVAALFFNRFIFNGTMKGSKVFIEIVIVALIILFFSEISPKVLALKHASSYARNISLILTFVIKIFTPLSFLFERLTHWIMVLFKIRKEPLFINEEELKTFIEVGEEKGTLDQTEREMIHSIFEFRDTLVKEVMVPRMDMVCLEKSTSFEKVLISVKEKGHSRIPVYSENVDNIVGILFVKDLFSYVNNEKEMPNLFNLLRKAYFVPENKLIDELLKEFQKERTHMAIVVDEYGGTAGLITLEDVIEEIVGEIRDEYDKEKPLIRQEDVNTWIVDAKIDIEDLNETLGLTIPTEEDYESLGGFIFHLLGRIPQENEKILYQDYSLIVEKILRQRIKMVRIIREKFHDKENDNNK